MSGHPAQQLPRAFRLTVAYDGTDFHGWQKQPGQRTVQGELERAVAHALGVESVTVNGAGRTDAGVHAHGQVASFTSDTSLPARAVAALATRALPPDVRIVAASEGGEGFHARHSARRAATPTGCSRRRRAARPLRVVAHAAARRRGPEPRSSRCSGATTAGRSRRRAVSPANPEWRDLGSRAGSAARAAGGST